MKQLIVKEMANEKISTKFYRMRLAVPYLGKVSRPGQFVKVRCSSGTDPLLRRPLGVYRIHSDGIEVLYEVVGRGTDILSHMAKGSEVDILGPLGNGFDIDQKFKNVKGQKDILVAGGIGVAPLMALAERLRKLKKDVVVVIGAKESSHVLCERDFKRIGCSVRVATEDGSKGCRGLVTDVLRDILRTPNSELRTDLYSCGPNGMLKAIWNMAAPAGISCQFSFESRMACGVGVCMGCPIKIRKGLIDFDYKMICKDGPVFKADEVYW